MADHAKQLAEALRPFVTGRVTTDKILGPLRLVTGEQVDAAIAALEAYDMTQTEVAP